MKTPPARSRNKGYALVTVLVLSAASMAIMASALKWVSHSSNTTERNNDFWKTVAAAESATEKALTAISYDFQAGGETLVYSKLNNYRSMYPVTSEDSYWSGFRFSNAQGNNDKSYIQRLTATSYVPLQSQYSGLKGMAATYRLVSNARMLNSQWNVSAGVGQEVQLATVPIFQFAIFYGMDLEINPGPDMNIKGRVHSNQTIYCEPHNTLTFESDLTASGEIIHHKKPGDPSSRPNTGVINYLAENDAGTATLNLPIGTNNSPEAVHDVIEIPPSGESLTSAMGKQRYYNKVDLTVVVTDGSGGNPVYTVKSGKLINGAATTIPLNQADDFISTVEFYNKREGKTVKAVQLNVGAFKTWAENNTSLRPVINRDASSIYIADNRASSVSSSKQPGVVITNGATLPSQGLTVASPNPIYVVGHFNAPSSHRGTTNTTATKPASIIGDAITVLSASWKHDRGDNSLSDRVASDTTVNAAFLAGIVPTENNKYSGGVENFPRFLENWSGKTFTYNGSMVVLFESEIAKAPWGGSDVYNAPDRDWTFDTNFQDATKLPPLTPQLAVMIRGKWAALNSNSVVF